MSKWPQVVEEPTIVHQFCNYAVLNNFDPRDIEDIIYSFAFSATPAAHSMGNALVKAKCSWEYDNGMHQFQKNNWTLYQIQDVINEVTEEVLENHQFMPLNKLLWFSMKAVSQFYAMEENLNHERGIRATPEQQNRLRLLTTMEVNWNGPQDSVRWWLRNYVCNRYPKVKFLCEECGDTSTHV